MAESTNYLGSGWMIYHPKGNVMDIYEPSMVRMYDNQPNCWTRARLDRPLEEIDGICTMKDMTLGVKSISSHLPRPPVREAPSNLWSIIEGWGNTWMWDIY
jgi:hypothetical protein